MTDTSKTPVTDWGNHVYSGLGDVGVFKANLGIIIGIILGIILIVVGIYMVANDREGDYLRVRGTVTQPNCVKSSTTYDDKGHPIDNYKCNIVVTYMIDTKVYSKTMFVTGSSNYIKDEPIDLMVDKKDYMNVQLAFMSGSNIGSILMTIALVVVGIAYLNYYLTHNYRIFASAQGANTIVSLFR